MKALATIMTMACLTAWPREATYAQETAGTRPTTAVYIDNFSPTAGEEATMDIVLSSLHDLLQNVGFDSADRSMEDTDAAATSRAVALADAAAIGADVAVTGFFRQTEREVLINLKVHDVAQGLVLASLLERGRPGLAFYNALPATVASLRPALEGFLDDRYVYVPSETEVREIILRSSDDGARAYLADRFVGSISEGELGVPFTPFEIGSVVVLRMTKADYHDHYADIHLDSRATVVAVRPMTPHTRVAATLFWEMDRFLGAGGGIRGYLSPDETFGELQLNASIDSAAGYTRTDASLVLGRYAFFAPTSPVRFYLSAGAGFLWSTPLDGSGDRFGDWYLSIANPTIEFTVRGRRLFVGVELRYNLGVPSGYWDRTWLFIGDAIPPFIVGTMFTW